jgi:hypothetical protein
VLYLDDPANKTTAAKPVVEADHGRIETRTATVSTDIAWLIKDRQWPGLAAVAKIERIRETAGKTTFESAYHLPQRAADARTFQRGRSRPLGRRKSAALAARCRHERRSRQESFGKRTPQSRGSPRYGDERHAK